jgi:hypothetical protein
MGQHNVTEGQDDARALAFQQALLKDLNVLELLCEMGALEEGVGRIGAEQELFLVDHSLNPAAVGPEVLAGIKDRRVTAELGRFNLEANLSPLAFTGCAYREFRPYQPASLWHANRRSRRCTLLVGKHIGV